MKDIDESITVIPYDPTWGQRFTEESTRLQEAFGDIFVEVEHIGSTAVPSLAAKPIIDIIVGVSDPLVAATGAPPRLEQLGYAFLDEAEVPGRLYFRKRGAESFNVHVVAMEGSHWRNNLLFRDYLRAHPEEAEAYAEHKRRAVGEGSTSLLAYSEGKSKFIGGLLKRAARWGRA